MCLIYWFEWQRGGESEPGRENECCLVLVHSPRASSSCQDWARDSQELNQSESVT